MKVIYNDTSESNLPRWLTKQYHITFALCAKLIRQKKIKLNGKRTFLHSIIVQHDEIWIPDFIKEQTKSYVANIDLNEKWIIYEDDNMVAINKPYGIATQGGTGIKISIDDMIKSQGWFLVHRLDKDTSGILLVAKNLSYARFLTSCFKHRTISKEYIAVLSGVPKKLSGTIDIGLIKNGHTMNLCKNNVTCVTMYDVVDINRNYCVVHLKPITGRTHQLRAHMALALDCPILGDVLYGGKQYRRMMLHAHKIYLSDGVCISIDSSFEKDFVAL